MKNTNFTHTANAITANVINKVSEELTAEPEKVFSRITESENSIINAISTVTPTNSSDDISAMSSDKNEKANITMADKVQLEILKLLKDIKSDMLKCTPATEDDGTKNPGGQKRRRRDIQFYYWTHGGGNHKSKDCHNKKDGHQDDATFQNKMGGSTLYCRKAS